MKMRDQKQIQFFSILILLSCIYSLCIILLSILPIAQLYWSIDQIVNIQSTFKRHPLVDILALKADNSQTCSDYHMQNLFNFTFPAIKDGCYCSDGELKQSLCSSSTKGSKPCSPLGDGENVYQRDGLTITNWGIRFDKRIDENVSTGEDKDGSELVIFQLCGLYKQEYNFLDTFSNKESDSDVENGKQQIVKQPNSCNYVDSEYDLFNLSVFNNLTRKDCPITSIQIVDIQKETNIDNQAFQYSDIPSTDYLKIKIGRSPQNYPLSEIEVSQGQGVCQDGQLSNPIDNKYKYYLFKDKFDGCDIDDRYFSINWSQLGQQDLFKANDRIGWLNNLPKFENDNKNIFSIYLRQFPKISWECRTKSVRSLLMNEININNLWYYQSFISIAAMCYIIIIQYHRRGVNRLKILMIYKFVLSTLHIGIEVWVSRVLDIEIIYPIENLCHLNCIDDYTQTELITIKDTVKQIQFYIQLPFYIFVAVFSIDLIYSTALYLKRKIIQRKESDRQRPVLNDIIIPHRTGYIHNNLNQLQRDLHIVHQAALNHNPRPDSDVRNISHSILPPNVVNPNSIFQIRMEEDSELEDKGNSTKDTQSIQRQLQLF